ncbi:MAG: glycosyltransferase family 2 protein [Bacteroidales bacterium]|jgi:glycosyltransferase involved in cell wall biosynthesis|nr:glycosyltransferase family 2 protein [Bacteroidales bacterium]MDD4213217.1 glycosyltransferase family 2 protein [Bacteroidales bacterium]
MQIKLSVVIITFNEERNVARCIDSVIELADDIIVVDSFSTDQTEQICKLKNVRFVSHVFDGHIEQKNWAVTQAKYPHILSLDADEAVDEELKKSILYVKNNWLHDGYTMNRLTNYCGKWIRHSSWYPDKKLRLWDSRKGKWGGINPHDKYELIPGTTFGHLKGNILHYSYYTISEHVNQVNKFSEIAAHAYYSKRIKGATVKLLISPVLKFIKMYLIYLGFLDGYEGFVIARISSHAVFLKYAKLRQLYKKEKINPA